MHQILQNNNIVHLTICGTMTHIYIDATARTAFDLGYKITLIRNAYATKDLKYNGKIVDEKYIQKSF